MEGVTYPLTELEKLWRVEYEGELSAYQLQSEEQELRLQGWREAYKSATKKGAPEPIRPDTSAKRPTQRRLILQDATFEKLHEILCENPAGVFVLRDELPGWLAELDRHLTAGELGRERFTVRQVYRHDWSGLTTPGAVRAAIEILDEAAWVRPAEPDDGPGRPSETFQINPEILEARR